MKKIIAFVVLVALTGCLGQNRLVVTRRGTDGVSVVDSSNLVWWQPPEYASTLNSPWKKFVRPNPLLNNWYDPWGNDPLSNYGVAPLSEQIGRLGPSPANLTPKKDAGVEKALQDYQDYLDRRRPQRRSEAY